MKWKSVIGILGVAGMMVGCAGQHVIHSRALAPTESEARELAEGQLKDQADGMGGGYEAVGGPHFSTKVVQKVDGAEVYEVVGSESVKAVK